MNQTNTMKQDEQLRQRTIRAMKLWGWPRNKAVLKLCRAANANHPEVIIPANDTSVAALIERNKHWLQRQRIGLS
jgi:hypothetical protein